MSVRRGQQGVRVLAFVAGVVVTLGAIFVAAHRLAPKHLLSVRDGHLYRSATLAPDRLTEVVDRHGIRTVVNLRSQLENERGDWHDVQSELLAEMDVTMLDLPMHSGHPPDDESLDAWLELLDDESRHPILVHCEYGVVRTGVMVAVYEMEHRGQSSEQAWADFELFGGDLEGPVHARIRDYVTGYRPRTGGYTESRGEVPGQRVEAPSL